MFPDSDVNDHREIASLPARIRRIVRWLMAHQQEVEAPEKLRLVFDCKGTSVRVERTEHDEAD